MPIPLYLDFARFGQILPDCAQLLREFADLLENEGQFPAFDEFVATGNSAWSDDLQERFSTVASWPGLNALKQSVRQLCGAPDDATVLFSGTSRQLARIAFHCLLEECESILCTDNDWPEFQQILRLQVAQAGALLHPITFRHFITPGTAPPHQPTDIASAVEKHGCDGMLLTSVAHDGLSAMPTEVSEHIDNPDQLRFMVMDASQHAGYRPIKLPSDFRGIVLAGTHKWLCSGVPLSFAVYVHGDDRDRELRQLRKAVRTSAYDDMLLLRTADLGLKAPNQTMRLEPLLAAKIAIDHALKNDLELGFANRCQNAQRVHELAWDQYTPLDGNRREGFGWFQCNVLKAEHVRSILRSRNVTVSAVGKDRIRMSMPSERFTDSQLLAFDDAIAHLNPPLVKAERRYSLLQSD